MRIRVAGCLGWLGMTGFGGVVSGTAMTEGEALAVLKERLAAEYGGSSSAGEVAGILAQLEAAGTFADLGYGGTDAYEEHLERLTDMAWWYRQTADAGAADAALLADLADGLDWWLREDFTDGNWWWRMIGFPRRLAPILNTVGEELEAAHGEVHSRLLAYYSRVHDELLVDPRGGGANLADMSYFALQGAIHEESIARIDTLREEGFGAALAIQSSSSEADGLRVDGALMAHGPQLYNGTYGHEHLRSGLHGMALLRGTPWDLGEAGMVFAETLLLEGVAALVHGDWLDYNAMGRALAREGSHRQGAAFLDDIDRLLALGSTRGAELEALRDEIAGDDATTGGGVRSLWTAGFVSMQQPGFYTSVRMVSQRNEYNESGGGQGLKNRYFGDGVNFLLVHGNEYDGIQPLWNYERLPGITAEQDGTTSPETDWGVRGRNRFAGAVTDGTAAVAAMRLEHDGLRGWKAWFLFDGIVVALGSDLRAPESTAPVFTTLNQALASTEARYGHGGDAGGIPEEGDLQWDGSGWAWQGGIGYFIPAGNDVVNLQRQIVSGRWSEIGTGSDTLFSREVFTLGLDHGVRPDGASYAYFAFPAVDAAAAQAVAAEPGVEILRRDTRALVVRHPGSGRTGIVFLRGEEPVLLPGGMTVASDRQALVLLREGDGLYDFYAADPLYEAGTVTLTLNRPLEGTDAVPGAEPTAFTVPLPTGDHQGGTTRAPAIGELAPDLLRTHRGGAGSPELRARSRTGWAYQLEQSPTMEAGSWEAHGEAVPGTGGELEFPIAEPGAGSPDFYRIRIFPEP
ncbi:MAG: hypothetical protein GVY10_10335 [Verrucomicrobia bacterium]|jgi:chondroitin AC lyase|nr:hypothetical protein [Verrucomicrobiota bacterium]